MRYKKCFSDLFVFQINPDGRVGDHWSYLGTSSYVPFAVVTQAQKALKNLEKIGTNTDSLEANINQAQEKAD